MIPLGDKFLYQSVLYDVVGNDKSPGKGVHSPDVGIKKIQGVGGSPFELGIKIQSAFAQPPLIKNHHHGRDGVIEICGELVGIPAEQQVASVDIDTPELSGCSGRCQLMFKGMSGQRGMICFDVYFEMINELWQSVGPTFEKYNAIYGKHAGDGMLYYFISPEFYIALLFSSLTCPEINRTCGQSPCQLA